MDNHFLYNGKSYAFKKDKTTGLITTNPNGGRVESSVYEEGHYKVRKSSLVPFLVNLPDFFFNHVLLRWGGLVSSRSVLDFGCGKGYFMFYLQKIGFQKLAGVETSKSRAEFAEELNSLPVSRHFYKGGKILEQKWDVITLLHVLEHIESPFAFLEVLRNEALNDRGYVFIEVPNIDSFSSKISGLYWAHFTPHFHTNHFNIKVLVDYCIKNRIDYKLLSTFSFYNGTLGMISAILALCGYKGSLFEDLKAKNSRVLFISAILAPFCLCIEFLSSFIFNKGSVIKIILHK